MTRQPIPGTPLAQFVERNYLRPTMHQNHKWLARRLTRLLSEFLGRTALVDDLTEDTSLDFAAWLDTHQKPYAATSTAGLFRTLCRHVGTMAPPHGYGKGRGKLARPLSDEPGTLWGLCLSRYFPANLRIRSGQTRNHYRTALCDLKEALGHEPTLTDLDDELIAKMLTMLLDRGLTAETVNERRQRIRALWEWCARKRLVNEFPTIGCVKVPRRIPRAWTMPQLKQLIAACQQEPGNIIRGIRAADWWVGLHLLLWDTSERIGAVFACRWEWLDGRDGTLLIPAEARKGQDADALYQLSVGTLAMLARLRPARQQVIFPWPQSRGTFFGRYERLLRRAGLPTDRKSKTHRMRRSVASHLQAAGHDACAALGHSTPDVTRKSYLDPMIVGGIHPCDVLPRLECEEPKRLN